MAETGERPLNTVLRFGNRSKYAHLYEDIIGDGLEIYGREPNDTFGPQQHICN